MAKYDYIAGHKRIHKILEADDPIEEDDKMPEEKGSTCVNGYYCWISTVIVNIRDSISLFKMEDQVKLSQIIRSFTSEVITILRGNESDNLVKEVGVRDDCVYAIYSTPSKWDIEEIVERVFFVNTYIRMLNKVLARKKFDTLLLVGVGMSSSKELVVNAEKQGDKIPNVVWVGDSVTQATKLSHIGARDDIYPIVISNKTYSNLGETNKALFNININQEGKFYTTNAVFDEFKDWVDKMPKL